MEDLFPGVRFSLFSRLHQLCSPFSAGVTMKLMDEVAGIVAARHCKTNIVTASVDAINFHDKIRKGRSSLCEMRGSSLGFLVPLHSVPTPVSARVPQEAGRERAVLCPSRMPVRLI